MNKDTFDLFQKDLLKYNKKDLLILAQYYNISTELDINKIIEKISREHLLKYRKGFLSNEIDPYFLSRSQELEKPPILKPAPVFAIRNNMC